MLLLRFLKGKGVTQNNGDLYPKKKNWEYRRALGERTQRAWAPLHRQLTYGHSRAAWPAQCSLAVQQAQPQANMEPRKSSFLLQASADQRPDRSSLLRSAGLTQHAACHHPAAAHQCRALLGQKVPTADFKAAPLLVSLFSVVILQVSGHGILQFIL